jgi:hypothetical protein
MKSFIPLAAGNEVPYQELYTKYLNHGWGY